MDVTTTIDLSGPTAALDALATDIERGFEATIQVLGQGAGRSIDLNFRRGGRPDPFQALAPRTVEARRERVRKGGPVPVAGFTMPERDSDALRKAASATRPGTTGSDVTLDSWGFSNTLTLPYAAIQNNGGVVVQNNRAIRIPAREFFFFQDADVGTFTDLVFADVSARIRRALKV